MTEKYHVVYSGWMIKSPPEKKLTGPWKIFRAKWKKRYFVLSKPAQSLPGTYQLNYYTDQYCRRVRGSIDLEQCAEIIESLDSDQFQYLLAIKTTHKSKERTYFLATETEDQMSTWVRYLCSVCGMKADETDTSPQPPDREELPPHRPTQTIKPITTLPSSAAGVMTRPPADLSATAPTPRATTSARAGMGVGGGHGTPKSNSVKPKPVATIASQDRDSEYIPLETCTSGNSVKRTNRQESVSSVPEELAPPPPPFKSGLDSDNDVFQTYDVPPSSVHDEEDDVYKVPPPRPPNNFSELEPYDIPPPTRNSPSTPRSSSSESQKADSAYSSQGTYDVPPVRGDGLTEDAIYDIPPSHAQSLTLDEVPPGRPPKPGHLQPNSQEAYMNLPTNSKVFSDKAKSVDINSVVAPPPPHSGMVLPTTAFSKLEISETYDVPKPSSSDFHEHSKQTNGDSTDTILMSTPPPPNVCGAGDHRYINAYQQGSPAETAEDMYLPMDPVVTTDLAPGKPRKSSSTDNEVEYTDMSGKNTSFDESNGRQSIYDHPPSRPTMPPPRPVKPTVGEKQDFIFSTVRTRSFKRKADESPRVQKKTSPKQKSGLSKQAVPLPLPVDRHPDFSTSDEDDEEMGSADVWRTTPPAPSNKDTELKYVDLDHDEDQQPTRSPHATAAPPPHTEYHEIDFLKTDALKSVKENVDEERNKEKNHS